MKRIVKIQKTKSNTFINIPVAMAELLKLDKGSKIELVMANDMIIVKKVEEKEVV